MGQGAPGRHLTAAAALTALLALLALTGCTADPEPPPPTVTATTPAPTPTPTPTPTETAPTPPTKPAAMDLGDETGAIAAAEYFMELFGYVMTSGDLDAWDAVSDPGCGFCSDVRRDVEATYQAGGRFEGATVAAAGGEVIGFDEILDGYGVAVFVSIPSGARLDADGEVTEVLEAVDYSAIVDVAQLDGQWRLVGVSTEGAT